MPEPYRTAAHLDADPIDEPPRPCGLCRRTFVPFDADIQVCAPCLRKACHVVERAAAASTKRSSAGNRGHWRPLGLATAALVFSVATFAMTNAMTTGMFYLAQARIAATQAVLAQNATQAKEKPAKKPKHTSPPPPREALALPPPDAAPAGADIPGLPSLLVPLRPESHEPDVLLARVQKLRQAGLDILLVRTQLGRSPFEETFTDLHSRVTPISQNGKPAGVRVSRVGADSLAALAGFQNGDVVVSINGYAMDSPEHALGGYTRARATNAAVFELFRNGRRVVLDVRWKDPATN